MASTDAKPVPIKNTAYRVTFAIYDADGDLVTAASSLDSEVSKDGGTFADCTSEATEIATGSGVYYLDLTATEMNADTVAVIVKTATSGAKTTVIVFYPQESGDIKVDVQTWLGSAPNALSAGKVDTTALQPTVAGRTLDVSAGGEAGVDWANVGSPATAVNLSATTTNVVNTATAVTTVNGLAANVITASSIASGALTAAKFAAGAFDAVWTVAVRILTAGTNIVLAKGTGVTGFNDLSTSDVTTACTASTPVAASVTGSVGSVGPNGITAASIATNAIDADALATDAVNEIADQVWDELLSGHITVGSAGKALADAAAGGSGGGPSAGAIATALWTDLLASSDFATAGSIGKLLKDYVDVAISSRMATYTQPSGFLATSFPSTVASPTNITAGSITTVTGNVNGSVGGVLGNVSGDVNGSVASVTGAVGSVTGHVGGNVIGSVGSLAVQAKADVNAEVVDALVVDTYPEPTSVPPATASLKDKIGWQAVIARNEINQTATAQAVRNDADSAAIGTALVSDDGVTATRGRFA